MVFNSETVRKTTYLVAGILPATFFGLLSLFFIASPLILWTAAAWTGIVGLGLATTHKTSNEIHRWTALMLIVGVAAMGPIAALTMLDFAQETERSLNYGSALMIVASVGPILVALHFLYFQSILLVASWLSILAARHNSDRKLMPMDRLNPPIP